MAIQGSDGVSYRGVSQEAALAQRMEAERELALQKAEVEHTHAPPPPRQIRRIYAVCISQGGVYVCTLSVHTLRWIGSSGRR